MISRFFIDRPIFAAVLSIVITLGGALAVFTLPIAQYPEITPPTVEVSASYPGANAQVVTDTVAAPIEQQVNGVEKMLYMSSQCTNDGNYTLTVTFELGTDLDMAQVMVQNRVAMAQPTLPSLVNRMGVSVKKKSPSQLMIVNLKSPKGTRDNLYLSNYATIQLRDALSRVEGVGDVTYIGQRDYSMRLWLDPQKMTARDIDPQTAVNTVQQQNVQVAAGQIGQPPVPAGQAFQYVMSTLGRLIEPMQFEQMILKKGQKDELIYMKDVSRVELGALAYDQVCTLDGRPTVALSVYQLPGSNALKCAKAVKAKMDELKLRFPDDVDYEIVYDTTPFVKESIVEVLKTLRDAVLLVALVVLVFLQNWRSTLIPLIAVPVAIVGTFAVMAALGFSLNNLSLFGLVLAIGIVVDDAIVVVEAVERHIEHGKTPREAAIQAMTEVSGPVVAVALVLCAVFIPCAFISGITGQFFRQFALTIAVSTVISAFNSLTLSPALAALLLKPRGSKRDPLTWLLDMALGWFFKLFNRGFAVSTGAYAKSVGRLLRLSAVVLLIYAGLLGLTYWGFTAVPGGFIPNQDKGYLLVNVQLPDSASLERTQAVMTQVEQIAQAEKPGVNHTLAVSGQSILLGANAPNFGSMYVMLDGFHDRRGESLTGDAIAARIRDACRQQIPDAQVSIFGAPPVDGLGNAGGFKMIVEARGDAVPDDADDGDSVTIAADATSRALDEAARRLVANGNQTPGLEALFTSFSANTPWLDLEIDREKVMSLGVQLSDVFNALQVYLGSLYVNDFNQFGRTWRVMLQADGQFRDRFERIKQQEVRNVQGKMVPLSTVSVLHDTAGPVMLTRYNMYPSAAVNGSSAPGVSSGQAIALMEDAAKSALGQQMSYEWTEITFMQLLAGDTAMYVFALAVVFVFLVLAAQYESWSLPLAVILVVPMCLLCSIGGVALNKMDVNIFTQIGFVVLVGLASKNAILIVEFAKAQREAGSPLHDATVEACRLRLRPIMMTSFAFILGVVPLVIAEGAGAEMRRALGTAVFSGMLGVTLFGIFLTPVFFYVIGRLGRKKA